jgi:hypothetical protein
VEAEAASVAKGDSRQDKFCSRLARRGRSLGEEHWRKRKRCRWAELTLGIAAPTTTEQAATPGKEPGDAAKKELSSLEEPRRIE